MLSFFWQVTYAVPAWIWAFVADRPQVLHVHCFGPNGVYAGVLGGISRRPLVISAHGETLADAHGVFDTSALLRGALKAALRDSAAVTGCSKVTLEDLETRFALPPDKGRVVFNGIDPEEPCSSSAPLNTVGSYVASIGRVVHTKGFDLLLAAFARLPQELDRVRLVIGGDGPDLPRLRTMATELGCKERVVFPGRLDRGQVCRVISDATVLVVPSLVEPFGIVVLEGWRAGVPVIATTLGGPPEFVSDGVDGLLVDPRDTDRLTHALSRVLRDKSYAQRIGAAGHTRSLAFTWANVADRYARIYQEVTS